MFLEYKHKISEISTSNTIKENFVWWGSSRMDKVWYVFNLYSRNPNHRNMNATQTVQDVYSDITDVSSRFLLSEFYVPVPVLGI